MRIIELIEKLLESSDGDCTREVRAFGGENIPDEKAVSICIKERDGWERLITIPS